MPFRRSQTSVPFLCDYYYYFICGSFLQVSIKPGYSALFSVEVTVPKNEGQYVGEVEMETDYEVSAVL